MLERFSSSCQIVSSWSNGSILTSFKRTCDLKQNGTQEKAPFSGIVFCALALGVVCFVPSVSSRNHFLIGQNSSFSQWEASIWWFQKLTVGTKRTTPQERQWETVPENSVFSWVPFCLRSLGPFDRCLEGRLMTPTLFSPIPSSKLNLSWLQTLQGFFELT